MGTQIDVVISKSFALQGHTVNQCPLPVSLCFFHRLIQAVRYYWDEFAKEHPGESTDSTGKQYTPVVTGKFMIEYIFGKLYLAYLSQMTMGVRWGRVNFGIWS